jgi:hypothetical protein
MRDVLPSTDAAAACFQELEGRPARVRSESSRHLTSEGSVRVAIAVAFGALMEGFRFVFVVSDDEPVFVMVVRLDAVEVRTGFGTRELVALERAALLAIGPGAGAFAGYVLGRDHDHCNRRTCCT